MSIQPDPPEPLSYAPVPDHDQRANYGCLVTIIVAGLLLGAGVIYFFTHLGC